MQTQELPLTYEGRRLALFTTTALYGSLAVHGALACYKPERDGPADKSIVAAGMKRYGLRISIRPGSGWPIRQPDGSYVTA